MKILFLDFDGVLNPYMRFSSTASFSKIACDHINTLLLKVPTLRIVVSSNWRIHGLQAVRDILKTNGIDPTKVIDITSADSVDHKENLRREHHIERWLKEHDEVVNFVIIDDDMEMPDMESKYVKTNKYVGFTQTDMDKAIAILNKDDKIH